jgi:hypothetical protein
MYWSDVWWLWGDGCIPGNHMAITKIARAGGGGSGSFDSIDHQPIWFWYGSLHSYCTLGSSRMQPTQQICSQRDDNKLLNNKPKIALAQIEHEPFKHIVITSFWKSDPGCYPAEISECIPHCLSLSPLNNHANVNIICFQHSMQSYKDQRPVV